MARPRQITDEAILKATYDCVMAHGAGVSTTVIADAVGVSQATLFKRFGTKEELVVSALMPSDRMEIGWMTRLEEGPTDGPIGPQLQVFIKEMVGFFKHMFPRMTALRSAGLMECAFAKMRAHGEDAPPVRGRRALAGWLQRGQARGQLAPCDPNLAATAIIGAAQGLAARQHMLHDNLEATADQYAEEIFKMIWKGLGPQEGA